MKKRFISSLLCVVMMAMVLVPVVRVLELGVGANVSAAQEFRTEPMISAGTTHTLALREDGTVWTWGAGSFRGELFEEHMHQNHIPQSIQGLTNVIDISAGSNYSLVLRADGTVWAWGENWNGQLGDGTTINRDHPVQVQGLNNIIAISAGTSHSIALSADGTAWTWGWNLWGNLGDGTNFDRYVPVQVRGLTNIAAISAGNLQTVALRSDGTVWIWGQHTLRIAEFRVIDSNVPVQVQNFKNIIAVSAGLGNGHTTALHSDGVVLELGVRGGYWGFHQSDDGTTFDSRCVNQVGNLNDIVSISAGGSHSTALCADGTVWAWGRNRSGELGDDTDIPRFSPVQSHGLGNITAITAGGSHTVALCNDGTVWTWGANWNALLGDGTTANRHAPVQVLGPNGEGFLNLGTTVSQSPNQPPNSAPENNVPDPETPNTPSIGEYRLSNLFNHSAYESNMDLAIFAAELSEAAYNYQGRLRPMLETYGMVNVETFYSQQNDPVQYTFASRIFNRGGVDYNLIFIVARGSQSGADWLNNAIINSSGNGGYHQGFSTAAQGLMGRLNTYLNRYGMTNQTNRKNIFFVTGHSQGGAVANLVARELNDSTLVDNNNLFAYTFASPNVTTGRGVTSHRYHNIFNIINRRDVVTGVPRSTPIGNPNLWNRFGLEFAFNMTGLSSVNIFYAHAMTTYLQWLRQNSDRTFRQLLGEEVGAAKGFSRVVSWQSPVDISIYNSDGELVGQIIDNEPINIENSEVFVFITDGVKQAFLPYGDTYTIKMIGTGDGTLTYAIENLYFMPDTPNTIRVFENIELYEGRNMVSEIVDTEEVRVLLVVDGEIVSEINQDGTVTRLSSNNSERPQQESTSNNTIIFIIIGISAVAVIGIAMTIVVIIHKKQAKNTN